MTRKTNVAGLLNRSVSSSAPAVLAWSAAILVLMPLIVLAGVIAMLATTALTVWNARRNDRPEAEFATLAPVVTLGHLPERERSLGGIWESVGGRAA